MSAVTFQSRSIDRISIRGCSGHVEDAGRGRSPDVHKKSPFPSLWACRPTLDVGSIARNPSQGSIAFGGGTDSKKWSQLRACRVFLGHLTRCTLWHRTVSCNRPSRHRIGRENTGDAHNARWSQPRQASDTTYSPRRASDQKKGHDMGKMSPKVVPVLDQETVDTTIPVASMPLLCGCIGQGFPPEPASKPPRCDTGTLVVGLSKACCPSLLCRKSNSSKKCTRWYAAPRDLQNNIRASSCVSLRQPKPPSLQYKAYDIVSYTIRSYPLLKCPINASTLTRTGVHLDSSGCGRLQAREARLHRPGGRKARQP